MKKNCPFCRSEITASSKFCTNCGSEQKVERENVLYFSEISKKGFLWSTAGYRDFLVLKGDIYILKIPAKSSPWWHYVIGFFLGSLLGLVVVSLLSSSNQRTFRSQKRKKWIQEFDERGLKISEKSILKNQKFLNFSVLHIKKSEISEKIVMLSSQMTIEKKEISGKKKFCTLVLGRKKMKILQSYLSQNVL